METKREELPYLDALHAMQSGVAMEMAYGGADTQPKHLRVGINAAMCDHAGLVRLLIQKGIISEEEYIQAITEEMNHEVERYSERLSRRLGKEITLR